MKNTVDGNYRIVKNIGEGTYSSVFKAIDQRTNTVVALKRVKIRRADDGIPKEFVREVETVQRFDHPNIIKISEVFVGKANINLVYEYCECDLEKLMNEAMVRPFTLRQIQLLLRQIVAALDQLHRCPRNGNESDFATIMHRDVKPSNIFFKLSADGATCQVKLADFGQARVI